MSNINGNREINNDENVATISINSHLIKVTYSRIFLFLFLLTFISVFSLLITGILFFNLIGLIVLAFAILWISLGIGMIFLWKKGIKGFTE